jgi:hypothetical protein
MLAHCSHVLCPHYGSCQQVDQLVFEQLVRERFPRLCESFLSLNQFEMFYLVSDGKHKVANM